MTATLIRIGGTPSIKFFSADLSTKLELPFPLARISAGFPSPADDFLELPLDLNTHLIKHPAATFYAQVVGNSMKDADLEPGDLLVVDKSLEPCHGRIVIAYLSGEYTVKRMHYKGDELYLMPANPEYLPIKITEEMDFRVWGVVTHVIKDLSRVRHR